MNTYFNIQPITFSVSPFETKTANAIEWIIGPISRAESSTSCTCNFLYTDDNSPSNITQLYSWTIPIPGNILNQWLDDSVIDDYICSTDSRFIKIV